jgi:hypothetical protein
MEQQGSTDLRSVGAGDKLIEAGVLSYPEALNALAEFRKSVQEKCRRALQEHLPDLSRAMAMNLSAKDIFLWPRDPVAAGLAAAQPWVCASVSLVGEEVYFTLGLYWDNENADELTVCAIGALEIWNKDFFALVAERLDGKPELGVKKYPGKTNFFSLTDSIPKDDPLSFQEKLHGIAIRWVDIWGKVGGLAGLLPEAANTKRQKNGGTRRDSPR